MARASELLHEIRFETPAEFAAVMSAASDKARGQLIPLADNREMEATERQIAAQTDNGEDVDPDRSRFWPIIRRRSLVLAGWLLLFFGILATISPTPFGIVLVGVALTMLLTHSPWTKLRFRRYARRYPQTFSPLLRIPSIKEAIKIRKRRRRARRQARAMVRAARAVDQAQRPR